MTLRHGHHSSGQEDKICRQCYWKVMHATAQSEFRTTDPQYESRAGSLPIIRVRIGCIGNTKFDFSLKD